MKAITRDRYGGTEDLEFRDRIVGEPGPGQVLLEVKAASLNMADVHFMQGTPRVARLAFGLLRPKNPVIGSDVAGTVLAVGAGVTTLEPGDKVYGDLSGSGFGAFAEQLLAPEAALALIPAGLSFEQAAAVPMAGVTALQALRDKARVRAGERVLVTGASGGVGSFAVQIAKVLGAHVTAVTSTANVAAVRELGVDAVHDRHQQDLSALPADFDVVIETAGHGALRDSLGRLKAGGRLVFIGGSMRTSMAAALRGKGMYAKPNRQDLEAVGELIESGAVVPFVGATFPLSQGQEAIRRFMSGQTSGKVVLRAGS